MSLFEQLGSNDVGEGGYPVPLGPYLLLERIAKGGMGEVHLAKHGGLAGIEKYCVVKTLKQGALTEDDAVRRFMDEARVVVNLTHRNICPVFDVGRADDRYYLAMEHVAGRDLKAVTERALEQGVAIPPAVALHLVSEVLEALDYAHRLTHPSTGDPLHLVHRDVSPANVMVSVEGEVKLIDFGLALSRVKEQRTEPHMVMGKLAYMAPEQLACAPLDKRTDLFAAGVVLYELLTNTRFYGDLSDGGIVHAAASGDYAPPKLHTLDDELHGILAAALARDPARRSPDCGTLRQQLVQYQLKRQMSAGSRELRELMEALFPEERARVRALFTRFGNVQGMPRTEGRAPEQAARTTTTGEHAPVVQLPVPPRPEPSGPVPVRAEDIGLTALDPESFAGFDTFDNLESSDTSTPVGRIRLTKVKADEAKPGRPRAEPKERLNAPVTAEPDRDGFDEPTQVVARVAVQRPPSRLPWAAAAFGLAAVAGAFFALGDGSESPPAEPVASVALHTKAIEPPAASALPAAAPAPAALEAAPGDDGERLVGEREGIEPAREGVSAPDEVRVHDDDKRDDVDRFPDGDETFASAAAAPPAQRQPLAERTTTTAEAFDDAAPAAPSPRRAQKRRRAPQKPLAPPGPNAKAEQKLRYLDRACRPKAPCAGELVDMFRGMRVDDARTFWPRVDACLSRCVK